MIKKFNEFSVNWSITPNNIYKNSEEHSCRIGKIHLSFNSENLRLRATIGGNMAFIGGENRQGYFKSISSIKMFVDENTVELSKVKTMNSLIRKF